MPAAHRNMVPDIIICMMVLGSLSCMFLLANFIRYMLGGENSGQTLSVLIDQHAIEFGWLLKLLVNCFGYSCVIVPGVLIYQYTKRINYLKEGRSFGLIPSIVKFCLKPADSESLPPSSTNSSPKPGQPAATGSGPSSTIARTTAGECLLYAYCFAGLNISYLSWGLLQEKIITQEYRDADGHTAHFRDSQFLVFVNRALALAVSGAWLLLAGAGAHVQRHRAPLFKYSYASLSNIMSAWFQYEALKFVSFPTQVLAKSCKIIPVMLMGKIVSRSRYEFYEYLTACLISLGMVFFLLGSADGSAGRDSVTTLAGVLLLTLYLLFDSFTANWQSDLFRTHGMSSVQMMCGVSGFSTLFTAASLMLQGGFGESLQFAVVHPKFIVDCVILSASSAVGQLFIFYTISQFGAVGFTIIMTIRQGIAILLSCIVYDHYISPFGIVGIVVVFMAIFMRVYCNHRLKSIRRKADVARGQKIGV